MAKRKKTQPLFNNMAIVFDFDDTLAPDTMSGFLESCGLKSDEFWGKRVQPLLKDGWDPIPAAFYCLVQESKSRKKSDKITRERFVEYGQSLQLFDGVHEMFERLRWTAHDVNPDMELEFYLVSSGIGDIIRSTSVVREFKAMWSCEFHYDESGEIAFPRQIISHTEKTRFLHELSCGIDKLREQDEPFVIAHDVPEDELHVPVNQIVYVGDGFTDIPCFSMINRGKGVAIGVYHDGQKDKWGAGIQSDTERVSNVAEADYGEDSELMESLVLSVKSVGYSIELRERSLSD